MSLKLEEVYFDVNVINDSDPEKQRQVRFLIEIGSNRSWIPADLAIALNIKTVGRIPLDLADGLVLYCAYGPCKFEYDGEIVSGTFVIGPKGLEPIAGIDLLEDFRLLVDLKNKTVIRRPAMKAK